MSKYKPNKFTKAKKLEFIELYVDNNFKTGLTCSMIGISTTTYRYAIKNDEKFAKDINEVETFFDTYLKSVLLDGIADQDTRLNYLKLLKPDRIDKLLFGEDDNSNFIIDKITLK